MSHVGFVHATGMNTSCHTHQYTRFWAWWSNQISKKAIRQSPTRILGKHSNMANPSLVSSVMLQCVAVSCSELHGSVLQRVAACCSVLRIHHWSPLSFLCKLSPWISRDCCDCCTCQCYTSQQFARQIKYGLSSTTCKALQNETLQHTATATHGKTVQNSAKHCKTLQSTAKHCNTFHHTPSHCIRHPSSHTAKPCKTLQHIATRCIALMQSTWCNPSQVAHYNALRGTAKFCNALYNSTTHRIKLHRTASHCNTLQHTLHRTASHCNTLQHTLYPTASHCNTLKRTFLVSTIIHRCDTTHIIWVVSHLWISHGCHTCECYMSQAI